MSAIALSAALPLLAWCGQKRSVKILSNLSLGKFFHPAKFAPGKKP